MKRSLSLAGLSLSLAILLLSSCSGGSSPTDPPPAADSVRLDSFTPSVSTTLTAGSQVTFSARVRYNLASADSGHISLVIQDQTNRNLSATNPQPRLNVSRGSGTFELSDRITIPTTGVTTVNVFFPLFPSGANQSSAAQLLSYTVH